MRLRRLWFILGAMLWLAVMAGVSQARGLNLREVSVPDATCTWNGTAGNWNDSTKWSCVAVPGAADTAIVSSGTITLTADVTVNTLTFSGGTIQGSSNLIATTMTWTGGTFTGSGTTTVNGTLDMSNSSATLDGRTFNNAGTATFGGSSVYLIMYNGAVFNNQAGASLQFSHTSTGQITYSTGGGTFNNSGAITKTGTSGIISYVSVPFNNNGSVVVNGGTLQMGPPASTTSNSSGTWHIASTAVAQFYGSGTINLTGVMTGTGTVQFSSAINFNSGTYSVTNTTVNGSTASFATGVNFDSPNVTISGGTLNLSTGNPITFNSLTQSGGTLTGSDNFTIGTFTWTGGTLSGASTNAVVNTTLTMNDASVTLDGRTLNNAGSATFGGATTYLYMSDGAVFNNQASAALQVANTNYTQLVNGTNGGTFNNSGVITKTFTSSGITSIYVPFNNDGSTLVSAGTLQVAPPSSTTSNSSGTWRMNLAAAIIQFAGNGTINLTGVVTGTGTVQFSSSAINFNSGTYSATNTTVNGGTVVFAPGTSFTSSNNTIISSGSLNLSTGSLDAFKNLTQSGGTLTGLDDFTIAAYTWTGGTLSGASTNATVTGALTMNDASVTLDGRTLNNAGSATFGGATTYLYMSDGAVFNNQASAALQVANTNYTQLVNGTNGGTFNNSGVITKTSASAGLTYIYVPFNNNGSVVASGGTLQLSPPGSTTSASSGTLQVATNATVQVAGSGTINFTGSVNGTGTMQFSSGTVNFNSGTYSMTNTTVSGSSVSFAAGTGFNSSSTTVNGGTLSLSTGNPITFNSLTQSGGTLTGSDNFTIGTFTWTGGTLSGAGTNATVTGALTMNNASVTLDGRTLNNAGSATLGGATTYLYMSDGAVFNNQASAALQVANTNYTQLVNGTNGGTFNNSGVITKPLTSNGFTYVYVPFNNSGSVTINGGTLYFAQASANTDSGPLWVSTGATVQYAGSGTQDFNVGGSLIGAGAVIFQSSNVNFNAGSTYAISNTQINGSTADFANANAVTFGDLTLSSGTLRVGDISVTGDFTQTFGTFTVLSGTVTFNGQATQNLVLNSPTTFDNLGVSAGTTLIEVGDANNATVNGTLTNQGTIRKSKAISGAGSYNFGLASATISVTVRGSLSSATISFVGQTHPAATGTIAPGRYWTIGPSGGGYTVSLTLPQNLATPGQAKVCYFDVVLVNWVCDKTSSTTNTVTLAGITELTGDWAIGGADHKVYLPLVIK